MGQMGGIVVVAVSQCPKGSVSLGTYEVGRLLLELGVVSAGDMTTEACVTKLAHLFGKKIKGDRLRRMVNQDLRGERTVRPNSQWSELLGGARYELSSLARPESEVRRW